MVTETLSPNEIAELERGAQCAEEDWKAGQPYASYHPWCSDAYRDGYALFVRMRRYHQPQFKH